MPATYSQMFEGKRERENDRATTVKCYHLGFPGESYTGILALNCTSEIMSKNFKYTYSNGLL